MLYYANSKIIWQHKKKTTKKKDTKKQKKRKLMSWNYLQGYCVSALGKVSVLINPNKTILNTQVIV